jgi:histidinol phosphatase-like PHP family hydrolase
MAKEEGILISINSDAHSSFEFSNLRYGVGQARRGWLEKMMCSTRVPGRIAHFNQSYHVIHAGTTCLH